MSRSAPMLVHSGHGARPVNQMSQANRFAPEGGRGRRLSARRRVQAGITAHVPLPDQDAFLQFWAGLMRRRCGCAAGVAQMFVVTEQTGRNWLAGTSCPTGFAVVHAMGLWPDEFAALIAA